MTKEKKLIEQIAKKEMIEIASVIRLFFNIGKTIEEVEDTETYDETMWQVITINFRNKAVWKDTLKTYQKQIRVVYKYLTKTQK